MFDLVLVDSVRVFMFTVTIIKIESLVIDVFSNSIYFNLRFVHKHFRVCNRAGINLSLKNFRFEKRTFSNANANLEF